MDRPLPRISEGAYRVVVVVVVIFWVFFWVTHSPIVGGDHFIVSDVFFFE